MEAKAFGQCTSALIDGTNEVVITTVGTKYTSFFIIAIDNTVTLTSVVRGWPLPADELTMVLPTGSGQITTGVVIPVGGQLGGLRSCTVSAGSGKFDVLFFTN